MGRTTRLLLGIPFCFTLLVTWFAWSALRAAPPLAAESLRGAALSIAAAIEQLAVTDPSFRSLQRYTTPDIAYFSLVDRDGVIRYHTNQRLIGEPSSYNGYRDFPPGVAEQRELLGTGEEIYLLRTRIHGRQQEYLLVLALHTYRADQVIRRARTGVTIVASLTVALWGLTLLLLFMLRREERHHGEMNRRKELARLGEMGAVMAHEIRNPLAGIKGFAQLIELAPDIEQARRHAGKIVTQSLRMETLVNDLLTYARSDQAERAAADLSLLVRECALLVHVEAREQGVIMQIDPVQPVMAQISADRVTQMLLNLLKNALQAMPEGGQLRIGLQRHGRNARIAVADTGTGIPPEQLPHIFEPFWTSKAKGTGLGLALCRKVAEEHSGMLTVQSTPGGGTEFTFTLPAMDTTP